MIYEKHDIEQWQPHFAHPCPLPMPILEKCDWKWVKRARIFIFFNDCVKFAPILAIKYTIILL